MKYTTRMALFGAFALALGAASAAAGSSGLSFRGDVDLASTGVDADARGRAKLKVRGTDDGRFEVQVKRLERDTTYELVLDGVRVGEIRTNGGGNGQARFRSRPRSPRDVLLGFDPRGATLVVRDPAGADVLAGVLSASTPSDDGDVICCLPDDSGPECEDRTPEECAAQGGAVSSATSCLPNPCPGTPPPAGGEVVCCLPDDSGPECEDRTADECAAQGGIVVTADSCTSNPCAAVPPADPDIRCCLPDDSGAECEDRTPAECLAQGGIDLGAGSCTPNPCADLDPPVGGGNASVLVRCERRASRSKVSVDGSGLAAGSYSARVVSGANQALSGLQAAVGDQAEFDFDSDAGDIAAGATAIASDFLAGSPPQALGQILDAAGTVVAEGTANCEVK